MRIVLQKLMSFIRHRSRSGIAFYDDQNWEFSEAESGVIPGAPPSPDHPLARRIVYGFTGVLVAITGGLGNALVVANLPYLQGALGLNLSEIAWLPTVYLITSSITGFILIKYRQQFGIRSFCIVFLMLYAATVFAHLFVDSMASAIAVRAASGISGAALTVLGVFYINQSLPIQYRQTAVALGIGLPQLALPLARLFPISGLALSNWHGIYLFELGLSLLSLAAVLYVRLPPNKRVKVFETLDALTFGFYACAIACFGAAVGMGSYFWWTDTPWIGWLLAISAPCMAMALGIEYCRARPLIDVRWLGKFVLLRFAIVTIIARIVFSEQTTGAIGLLRGFGLTNDDIRPLSLCILLAAILGVVVGAIAAGPTRLTPLVMMAVGLVAVASFMDTSISDMTRAPQLIVTQSLIAFATTVFIGPSFLFGLSKVLAEGGSKMTSFIALFGITQSLGSLIGVAFVQTSVLYRQQFHLQSFDAQLAKDNPLVTNEITRLSHGLASTVQDPTLRFAESVAALGQRALLEAQVAAYADVFYIIFILASLVALFLLGVILHERLLKTPSDKAAQ
ncbi:MFS transporter [Rhizobium oryziradicis]|nr:MFS transporter [Rhizobium oryziradicis]